MDSSSDGSADKVLFDNIAGVVAYNHVQTHFTADAQDLALLNAIYNFLQNNGLSSMGNLTVRVVEPGGS